MGCAGVCVPCAFSAVVFNTSLIFFFYLPVCFLKKAKETTGLDRWGGSARRWGRGNDDQHYTWKTFTFNQKINAIKERKGRERERESVYVGGGVEGSTLGPRDGSTRKGTYTPSLKIWGRILGSTWKREAIPSCPLTSIYALWCMCTQTDRWM